MVKQTKNSFIGNIPKDWVETEWGYVAQGFTGGSTPSRLIPENFHGSIPWVTSGELNHNIIVDTIEKISKNAQTSTNLQLYSPGTFLMAITGLEAAGTRGSCAILGIYATTNQSCLAIFPTDKLDIKYLVTIQGVRISLSEICSPLPNFSQAS